MTIKLWEVATGQEVRTFKANTETVWSVAFSPDGKLLASGSDDKTVKLWEVATGQEVRTLKGHTRAVTSVVFSPDGKLLASGSYREIKLWDVATGQEVRTLRPTNWVFSVAFSPDGRLLASGSKDETIKLWDISDLLGGKLSAGSPLGQGYIKGQVEDASTSKVIQGATVEASGPATSSTTTDSNGNYTLTLPPGTYTLTASASGYQPQTKTGIPVTAGQTTTVDFALTPTTPINHPPNPPTELAQLLPDGTLVPVGGMTNAITIVFRGNVSDPDNDKVKLQVELRRLDELGGGFDETRGGLKDSDFVSSGTAATATAQGLIPASYHWRARTMDEHGLTSPWVEFGNNPSSAVDFLVTQPAKQRFWVEVRASDAPGVSIRKGQWDGKKLSLEQQPIMTVPNDWVLQVVNTYEDAVRVGETVWWEVRDATWPDGTTGWIPKANLAAGSEGGTTDLSTRAALLATPEARREAFLSAVLHYYYDDNKDRSLYSGGDVGNNFSVLRKDAFPIELIMAIALHEGAAKYNFDNCIYDQYSAGQGNLKSAGVGIMQIHGGIFPCSGCNKGWGSGLQNFRAYNAGAYCDKDGIYRHDYYGNTWQGIYANVKDAFRVLQWALQVTNHNVLTAVNRYNTDPEYPAKVASYLDQLETYFPHYKDLLTTGGYTPLSDQQLADLRTRLGKYIYVKINSPVSLQVWDPLGRVTGLVEGLERVEIPNSFYADGTVILFERDLPYRYVIVGNSEGVYGLVVTYADGDRFVRVEGDDITISPGTVHQYTIDWSALNRGEKGVTIQVDQNGDGVFERTVHTGNEVKASDLSGRLNQWLIMVVIGSIVFIVLLGFLAYKL
jgi:flagellar hook assembly protein FlgD